IHGARRRTRDAVAVVGVDRSVAGTDKVLLASHPGNRATKVDALPPERLESLVVVDEVELAFRVTERRSVHSRNAVSADVDLAAERAGLVGPQQVDRSGRDLG